MSLTVVRSLQHVIPEISPPDDPGVPHEWLASAWEPKDRPEMEAICEGVDPAVVREIAVNGSQFLIRVSCLHCRTVCVVGFGRDAGSLVEGLLRIRRWPVDASCREALVRSVMES